MIAKIIKGKSFRGIAEYLLANGRSRIIGGNMAGVTPRELASEFGHFRKLRAGLSRAVAHISLSSSPEDGPMSDDQWNTLAQRFMDELGYSNCPLVMVKHHEVGEEEGADHEHIHIVASRVDVNGQTVSDAHDFRRAEAILRSIEIDYGLRIVGSPRQQVRSQKSSSISNNNNYNQEEPMPTNLNNTVTTFEESEIDGLSVVGSCELSTSSERKIRDTRRVTRDREAYEAMIRAIFGSVVSHVYYHQRGTVIYCERPSRIADNGNQLVAYYMAPELAAQRMVALIVERKGWTSVVFRGTDAFVETAIREAFSKGLDVQAADASQAEIIASILAEKGGTKGALEESEGGSQGELSLSALNVADKLTQRRALKESDGKKLLPDSRYPQI